MDINDDGHSTKPVNRLSLALVETQKLRETTSKETFPPGDWIDVSGEAKMKALIHKATEAAIAAPDIDLKRVDALKKAIADGSYSPDLLMVAEKMIEEDLFFTNL